jgi:hypothetical protein
VGERNQFNHYLGKLTSNEDVESDPTLYDVQFYPFATTSNDSIFAVTGARDVR